MTEARLQPALSMPAEFRFDEVSALAEPKAAPTPAPPLGPLAAFTGTFRGKGFNTIFRPDLGSPAKLPVAATDDNLLELNLTEETLSFSPSLGAVPNRGEVQADVNLNGVPYLQVINDVTDRRAEHRHPLRARPVDGRPGHQRPRRGTTTSHPDGLHPARHHHPRPGQGRHHPRQAHVPGRPHHPLLHRLRP